MLLNLISVSKGQIMEATMFDIFNRKKVKKLKEYISTLEIKVMKQDRAYTLLKEDYEELKKKYNKLKLEMTLNK